MNSRDTYWLSTGQIEVAPAVKKMSIEPIPTGYIILEPGRTVGWLSNANLIPRNKPDIAAATALASEYMGARLVITDSGSGAESPAPLELIRAVKSQLNVPYFYAGGCRTADQARDIVKAGADGIHVGTAFEIDDPARVREKVASMSKAIREAGREKLRHPIRPKPEHGFLPMIRPPRWLSRLSKEALDEKLQELKKHREEKRKKGEEKHDAVADAAPHKD
jgi:phosphoglycerol geranylgeranyltransferase